MIDIPFFQTGVYGAIDCPSLNDSMFCLGNSQITACRARGTPFWGTGFAYLRGDDRFWVRAIGTIDILDIAFQSSLD